MDQATSTADSLDQVVEIFGGPLEVLPREQGCALLAVVNEQLASSAHQPHDEKGHPGGLVLIPETLTPIIIGDLHARVDNLLRILCEGSLLKDLEEGTACLVFLGDAVHPDEPELLDFMESSVLMMDLVFRLMLRYPNQVFYVLGNHDSFSEEVDKGGVLQGLLWEKHLVETRGEEYRDQMEKFYQLSPVLASAPDFLACHAGPPREKVSCQMMINIAEHPRIIKDLLWNRMSTPVDPMGYSRSDVKRFRKSLKLDKEVHFIVAHSAHAGGLTAWENIGNIPNHHLVYSALDEQVGIFTRVDGEMVPQVYATESLLVLVNARAGSGNSNGAK